MKEGGGLVWANGTNSAYRILAPVLMKADARGQEEWSKRKSEEFTIAGMEQAKAGGYLVLGALRSEPGKSGDNSVERVLVTKSGELYVQGIGAFYDAHMYVAKLSEEADKLWDRPTRRRVRSRSDQSSLRAMTGFLLPDTPTGTILIRVR